MSDERFNALVAQVASSLTPLHIRALDELDDFYGRGPGHLAANLNIPIKDAREILQFFRKEGICDYGSLFGEDDGLCKGRGYWLDRFGRAVKTLAMETV